jgi:hypothetical protein
MERLLKRPVKCLGWGEDHMLGPETKSDSLFGGGASSLTDLIRYYANIDGQELLTIFLCENYRGHPSFLMVRGIYLLLYSTHSNFMISDPSYLYISSDALISVLL